jgi:pyruvate dehydrogenase E2 component (dihydrolipoamide acetyltransferase)
MAQPVIIEAMRGTNYARVVSVPAADGETVTIGQTLLEVENHKVVQEITSPAEGVMVHALAVGDLLRHDTAVAFVAQPGEDMVVLQAEAGRGLAPAGARWDDLVCPVPAQAEIDQGKPVSIAKATEIAVLGGGAGNSLLATLGARLGPINRGGAAANFFTDKVLDLVVYEAARLLAGKKFRTLNARFADGKVIPHERISAGVSFDEGGRLTLFAIPDTEQLDLAKTQDALVDGLMRYVGRRLTLADVASSTFTVSDVTATDLNLSVPLLPRDQCIIIVVIRDGANGFLISIGYDHRITEGLTVANFATELVKRVRSYSLADEPGGAADALAPVCSFCERSVIEETRDFRRRGLVRMIDAEGHDALCCSSCWEGW